MEPVIAEAGTGMTGKENESQASREWRIELDSSWAGIQLTWRETWNGFPSKLTNLYFHDKSSTMEMGINKKKAQKAEPSQNLMNKKNPFPNFYI